MTICKTFSSPPEEGCRLQPSRRREQGSRKGPAAAWPADCRGFTLLEIVIALLVLSIVAISAVKASGNAVNNIHYLKQQTFAHWVAMNKARELQLAPEGWELEENSGTVLLADGRWHWSFEVQETPEAAIRRVQIEVRPEGGGGDPAAVVTIYRRRH